jgi:hypothetical protein
MRGDDFGKVDTSKGYMRAAAKTLYLREMIESYAMKLRREQGDPAFPVYLVMDSRDSHNRTYPLDQMAAANVVKIWLPAYSSHFL